MCSSPSAKSSRARELGDGPATFMRKDCGVDAIGLELSFARIFCHNESRWQGVGASVSRCGWSGPPAGSSGMQAQTKPKHRLFACAGRTSNAIRLGTGVDRLSEGTGSMPACSDQTCRPDETAGPVRGPMGHVNETPRNPTRIGVPFMSTRSPVVSRPGCRETAGPVPVGIPTVIPNNPDKPVWRCAMARAMDDVPVLDPLSDETYNDAPQQFEKARLASWLNCVPRAPARAADTWRAIPDTVHGRIH